MDSVIRFPSLGKPEEFAYTAHANRTDLWDSAYRSSRPLACWAGHYLTYGDGMIQHSHETVTCAPLFEDYCASLAAHLLEHPGDAETLGRAWPAPPPDKDVRFALSVRFKEGKCQYYNPRERKVSCRESLRHDKRWHRVAEWMDGGAGSAYRICRGEDTAVGLIEAYALYGRCREVRADEADSWDQHPVDYFDLDADRRTVIGQAFDAADYLVRSWRARNAAEGQLDCYRNNIGRHQAVTV